MLMTTPMTKARHPQMQTPLPSQRIGLNHQLSAATSNFLRSQQQSIADDDFVDSLYTQYKLEMSGANL